MKSISNKNNDNVRFFILISLNHGRNQNSLIPLRDRVSVWVAATTRKILSLLQLFARADLFRESDNTAKCHFPLGRSWSTSSTRSTTCAFCRGLGRFCLSCRAGTYSFNRRFQKWLANNCVCLHFFLNSISSFTKVPGGKVLTVPCNNRWFGVNGWRSFGSSEMAQRDLESPVHLLSLDFLQASLSVQFECYESAFPIPHWHEKS